MGRNLVPIVILACVSVVMVMTFTAPIWRPIVQKSEENHRSEIMAEVKPVQVVITEKNITSEMIHTRFGNEYKDKKYFVFTHEGVDYYVSPSNSLWFNRVKKDDTINVYFYKKEILGVTKDGLQSMLIHL